MSTVNELVEGMARIAKRMYSEKDATGPWTIDGYLCATDGRILCAMQGDYGARPDAPTRLSDTIRRWLAIQQAAPRVVPVARLRAFAEVNVSAEPCARCRGKFTVCCTRCDGNGTVDCECSVCGDEHTATCSECDEDGQMSCPECHGREKRIGLLLNSKLNTVLLRDILTTLATDERDIAISLEPLNFTKRLNDTGFMFRPIGDGVPWVALLMPMLDVSVPAVVTFETA
jgi:hypothetical protein